MPGINSDVYRLGQSIWYDNIQRDLLVSGQFKHMVDSGWIYGVTSNPSIFQKAIAETADYDEAIQPMAWSGVSPEDIFYELAIEDIQTAADILSDLYQKTHGQDGYVSLEVNPFLANQTAETIEEAQSLWEKVNRPNLMVKIPATKAGLPAIRKSIAAGININVTLIFSTERYQEVIDAYMSGLEDRIERNLSIENIASVASFFVSRLDTKVDKTLDQMASEGIISSTIAENLKGKAGLANSRQAYRIFQSQFSGERFTRLKAAGARQQRPLWASTSTKNPGYSDVMYVEGLIVPETVNTVPPKTLSAFQDHGSAKIGFDPKSMESEKHLAMLIETGIDMDKVTRELEIEGVASFSQSYHDLLDVIEKRSTEFSDKLGNLSSFVAKKLEWHQKNKTIDRLFQQDTTLWTKDPVSAAEIGQRLGWLNPKDKLAAELPGLMEITKRCWDNGFESVVLLGMGGSSLASEVMANIHQKIVGNNDVGLKLIVLDSTNPIQIKSVKKRLNLAKTLFLVSSKSGSTLETLALMEYFWAEIEKNQPEKVQQHFIAITDPGSKLETIAKERQFREIVLADPTVGGRFSALTVFGMLPASLSGVDIEEFLDHAEIAKQKCVPSTHLYRNPGLLLGIILAEGVNQNKNKLTFLADPEVNAFGTWAEQLIAESSGKNGTGILPVVHEPHYLPETYAQDRLFVYLQSTGENDRFVNELSRQGHPLITYHLQDFSMLAEWFYVWEIAISVASSQMKINAFDQPDVQDSKTRTNMKVDQLKDGKKLSLGKPVFQNEYLQLYWSNRTDNLLFDEPQEYFRDFLSSVQPGDFFSINAFLPETPDILDLLQQIRKSISEDQRLAATVGFGPRYLHSTGQFHKGGPNNGYFLIITHGCEKDLLCPSLNIQFCDLVLAQALGDLDALQAKNRKIMHIHIPDLNDLNHLTDLIRR